MKSFIRRVLPALCVGALAVALSACGSSSSSDSATSTGASAAGTSASTGTTASSGSGSQTFAAAKAQTEKLSQVQPLPELPPIAGKVPTGKTVAIVNCTLPTCVPDAGVVQAKALGWDVVKVPIDVTKGPSDAVRALDQAISKNPDFIYLKSLYPMEPLAKGLAEAKKKGIPVVQYAGTSGTPDVVGCVNCDPEYVQSGSVVTDAALADAGQATGIVFVCDQNYTPLQQLNKGFDDVAARAKDTGTEFNKVNVDITQPPAQVAQTVVNFVRSHPKTQYVIACIPEVATAVPQALSQAGLASKIKLLYSSPHPQELAAIKAGTAFAALTQEAEMSSWRGFDMMARLAAGDEVPEDLRNPVGWMQLINKDNADQVDSSLQPPGVEQQFAKLWGRE